MYIQLLDELHPPREPGLTPLILSIRRTGGTAGTVLAWVYTVHFTLYTVCTPYTVHRTLQYSCEPVLHTAFPRAEYWECAGAAPQHPVPDQVVLCR